MGYDDGECVACYCNGSGNNCGCSSYYVCFGCMGVLFGNGVTGRLMGAIARRISDGKYCITECCVCDEDEEEAFCLKISMCDYHANRGRSTYKDEKEEEMNREEERKDKELEQKLQEYRKVQEQQIEKENEERLGRENEELYQEYKTDKEILQQEFDQQQQREKQQENNKKEDTIFPPSYTKGNITFINGDTFKSIITEINQTSPEITDPVSRLLMVTNIASQQQQQQKQEEKQQQEFLQKQHEYRQNLEECLQEEFDRRQHQEEDEQEFVDYHTQQENNKKTLYTNNKPNTYREATLNSITYVGKVYDENGNAMTDISKYIYRGNKNDTTESTSSFVLPKQMSRVIDVDTSSDDNQQQHQQHNNNKERKQKPAFIQKYCDKCRSYGHYSSVCGVKCNDCGVLGHYSKNCHSKK